MAKAFVLSAAAAASAAVSALGAPAPRTVLSGVHETPCTFLVANLRSTQPSRRCLYRAPTIRGSRLGAMIKEQSQKETNQRPTDAYISDLTVEGPLNLQSADVPFNVTVEAARFGAKVVLDRASFRGDLRFGRGTVFASDLTALRLNVGSDAVFQDTLFVGTATLNESEIKGGFAVDGSTFERAALFEAVHVGETFNADGATFRGKTNFLLSTIRRNFTAENARFLLDNGNRQDPTVDLSWMKVSREIRLRGLRPRGTLKLQGLDFGAVSAGDVPGEWGNLDVVLDKAQYCPDVYEKVERYFRDAGRPDLADEVYIKSRWREGKSQRDCEVACGFARRCSGWLKFWLNRALWALVGYGRGSLRILVPIAAFIFFGCVAFGEEVMRLQPGQSRREYSRFWYSLDLFLPFADLRAASVWEPRERTGTRIWGWDRGTLTVFYTRLHRLAGWFLVPLGLAAVSGLIR